MSGTSLNVAYNEIGVSSTLSSSATIAAKMVGTLAVSSTESASATIANHPELEVHLVSSLSSSGSVSSIGYVNKLGQAHIINPSPFTSGFTNGFERGSNLAANGIVEQNTLQVKVTLSASGVVGKVAGVTLSSSASMRVQHAIVSSLRSNVSLAEKSVLIHRGAINLTPIARLEPRLSSEYDNPDILNLTLYLNKSSSFTIYANKSEAYNLYIDKQFIVDGNIDKIKDNTGYIDKVIQKTLVRER